MSGMKILHVVHEFAPFTKETGGTGRYVYGLARAQLDLGHQVTVLTRHQSAEEKHLEVRRYLVDDTIPVYDVNISRFDAPEQLYRREDANSFYTQLLNESGFDLVHIHHFIGTTAAVAECCNKQGVPYGITFHDFWPFCIRYHMIDYGRQDCDCARQGYALDDCIRCLHACHFHHDPMNENAERFLATYIETRHRYFAGIIEKASFVTGPSLFIKKIYDEKYRLAPDRFVVEPLGMAFAEASQDNGDTPWVQFGYIGAIETRKGVDILLRAFQDLPYPLHLWGNDPREPAFKEHAKTRPNLHYHGAYNAPNDLPHIFSRIHLCIVPSLSESYGITARESLSYGVPVIASNWGGMPEAVIHERNGLLFEVGSEDSLREAIFYAAEHREKITEMKKHTRETLIPMQEHARHILSLYGTL